jgi:hypothetical protein
MINVSTMRALETLFVPISDESALLHPVVVRNFGWPHDAGFTRSPPQDSTEPKLQHVLNVDLAILHDEVDLSSDIDVLEGISWHGYDISGLANGQGANVRPPQELGCHAGSGLESAQRCDAVLDHDGELFPYLIEG